MPAATAQTSGQTVSISCAQGLELARRWLAADRLDEADALAAALHASAPDDPAVWVLRGRIALRRGKAPLAGSLVRQALAAGRVSPELYFLQYEVELALGRHGALPATAAAAVALAPENPDALYQLAAACYVNLDIDGALAACRKLLTLHPKYLHGHGLLAQTLLLRGDFAEGWEEYKWRFREPGAVTPLVFPGHWDGSRWQDSPASRARLLLLGDQGLGDVIQFSRYLGFVAERCRGADLVLSCAATLHPLLRPLLDRLLPGAGLVDRNALTPGCNAFLPLSLLPGLAGTRLDSVPGPHPYLHADPAAVAAWRARLDARLPGGLRRVGLVWSGNPEHVNDSSRSMPLAALAPLTEIADIALISLQKGAAPEAQMQQYSGRAPWLGLGAELADFGDTAAVLAGLDVLVTIDSAPAHLAGALGVPTLLMLPYAPDWRWLLGRSDSPWYPSLRLVRQPRTGDWDAVVAAVAAALAAGDVPPAVSNSASAPSQGANRPAAPAASV